MKQTKMLLGGAVSLALAALPTVGALATTYTTLTDTINITIGQTCTLNAGSHSYSATISVNQLKTDVGTTTINVKCNQYNGYTLSATMTALTNSSSTSNTIPYAASAPAAGTAKWTAVKGESSSTTYITSGSNVMSGSSPTGSSGTDQKVSYKVATGSWQPTGTYTGTATYTLVAAS